MFNKFFLFCSKKTALLKLRKMFFVSPDKFFSLFTSPNLESKKGVLKNFAKFTEKHLCQSLFFNKIAGLRGIPEKWDPGLGTRDPYVGRRTQNPHLGHGTQDLGPGTHRQDIRGTL